MHKEDYILQATFTLRLPESYFDNCLEHISFPLNAEAFNNATVKEFYLETEGDIPHERLVLKTVCSFNISREDNVFKAFFENKEESNQELSHFFTYYINSNTMKIHSLFVELIKYIIWKKLKVIKYSFNHLTMSCKWTSNDLCGYIDFIHINTIEFLGVAKVSCVELIPDDFEDFYKMRKNGESVPIYHELLAESKNIIGSESLRSSYLILYSSLEVATKIFISKMIKKVDYLILEMQSPSLEQLYRKYINTEIIKIATDKECNIIQEMTNMRNKVAHMGKLECIVNNKKIELTYNRYTSYRQLVESIIARLDVELAKLP